MEFGINCGHTKSGAGSGAVGIINESVETRNVGYALIDLLKNNGHSVIDCTIDKAATQNAYLSQAVQLANKQDLDYFISIHFNAGGGKGTEIYTYKGNEYPEALNVCKNISTLGFNNRGIKDGSNLYVIRKTKAKSMLIEVCFVDSDDVDRYLDIGAAKIAEAIYEGITDANNTINVVQPEPTPQPTSTQKTSVDDWVKRLQEELNSQFGAGLVVDGINGPKTLKACPMVKKGAKGNVTRLIQERLNRVGFNLTTDGIFGENTKNAVIVFQRNRGLTQDGIVGKNTWEWLLKGTKM